jgi:RNA polymerase sigma-70 factor (ECF subfamily)
MKEWGITLIEAEAGSAAEARNDAKLSFEEAFEIHHRLVYRYALTLTRDVALAEDATQEVFLRLHRQLDSAQHIGMLRAWLLRVTANAVRNLLRTRRRSAAREEAFGVETTSKQEESGPDGVLVREAEVAKARHVLGQLKEPWRSCLLLRNEGLSYREVAEALGLKESSIGKLLARGRKEFVKLYRKVGQKQ